jgi:hypothetical protein
MRPRTYAIALSAFGLGLFLAVAGTNLIINPMGVLGTKLLPRSFNNNDRYTTLAEYESHPDRYDALAFGSSRLRGIPLEKLSQPSNPIRFAYFGVNGGMLTDHLAVLNYVLHRRPGSIKHVFILLDADRFGTRPLTDESLSYATPPALSGENPIRFWWRNLTAIQFKAWRSAIREAYRSPTPAEQPSTPEARPPQTTPGAAVVEKLTERPAVQPSTLEVPPGTAVAEELTQRPAVQPTTPEAQPPQAGDTLAEKLTDQPLYPQHLALWRQFVALCRDNRIELIVAISPLSRIFAANFDAADLSTAIDDIVRLAPAWDFTGDYVAADDPRLWDDPGHFGREIGTMMTDRMSGRPVPDAWSSFGDLRTQPRLATTRPE